jgi:hypothetical protein
MVKWWKFPRPPEIWTPAWILACRAGTTSRYSAWETPPIKAERPEPSDHLRSTCLRGNTSTRIWTRALQPDQEEVSSWRFCRAQIVSGRQTFPPIFLLGAEIFARRRDFNPPFSRLSWKSLIFVHGNKGGGQAGYTRPAFLSRVGGRGRREQPSLSYIHLKCM